MVGRSRKRIVEDKKKKGAKVELPSFASHKTAKDYDVKKDDLIIVEEKKQKKGFSIKKFAIIACLLLVIATLVFVLRFINFNVTEMLWKVSLTRGSSEVNNKSIRYEGFLNGMVRISNDGITYISSIGEVKWTISYNMKEPIYECNKKYFSIAERNGFDFYIFDTNGLVYNSQSKHPIQKISLTDIGELFLLESDDENSYISHYDINGKTIGRTISTNLTSDGMPIDISASSSGESFLVDYTCLSDNSIYSKATYYDDEDVLGEFITELADKFLARVHFFDSDKSCLIYDDGIHFVSYENVATPKINHTITFDEKIRSITYNDRFLAIITEKNRLLILNKSGDILSDKIIDFDYDNFYINDDYIIFICDHRVMISDERGRIIFDKEMNMDIEYVAKKKSLFFTELLLGLIDGVECIRFY